MTESSGAQRVVTGVTTKPVDLRPLLSAKLRQLADGAPEVYFTWPGVGRLRLTPMVPEQAGGVIVVHRARFALGDIAYRDGTSFTGVYLDAKRNSPRRVFVRHAFEVRATARLAADPDRQWLWVT